MPRLFTYKWFAVSLYCVLPAVIACVLFMPVSNIVQANEVPPSKKDTAQVEKVGSVAISSELVQFDAISHGCTDAVHFELRFEIVENSCRMTIIRTKPDLCRRAPFAVSLSLESGHLQGCDGNEIYIANPVLIINDDGLVQKRLK